MILDEKFGVNIDMTGDGHIEEEKVIFLKGCISQRRATKKRNISQLLVLQSYLMNSFVGF